MTNKEYEKIMRFINDEDYHAEDENGESSIDVMTLNTFFKVMKGQIPLNEELTIFFKM